MTYLQKYETENEHGSGTVLSWASIVDDNTVEQACKISRLPVVDGHVALMPDAHFGFGPPVGTAVRTVGAVIPGAVGVDIGCGMIAVKTSLSRGQLGGYEGRIMAAIREGIPSGVGIARHKPLVAAVEFMLRFGYAPGSVAGMVREGFDEKCGLQFGTLGAGNHFAEVSQDADGQVWMVVHSGSRGPGNVLATLHAKVARAWCEANYGPLEDPGFAFLPNAAPEQDAYLADMLWAQEYAFHQREAMMDALIEAIESTGWSPGELERINCHHNYALLDGQGWLTRKGAIDASLGTMGIIPGSMGAATYIVRGLGNEQALNTAPHGAGRVMSRNQARKMLDVTEFKGQMAGKTWLDRDADKLLDEAPGAYKPIETVMADSRTLVEPVAVLSQFINYKGV